MAEDVNNIVLIGRLTKDPELKFTPGKGTAVCTFNLAVNRRQSKSGNEQQTADFIPIVVWGKVAESVANYMAKGRQICIIGRLQIRNYTDKNGNKRYATEVVANQCQFLGSKNENGNGNSQQRPQNKQSNNSYNNYSQSQNQNSNTPQNNNFGGDDFGDDITPIDDGDIPF